MATRLKTGTAAGKWRRPQAQPQRLLAYSEQIVREYATLTSPLKTAGLKRWAAGLDARLQPALHRLYFGSIEWPRTLAEPQVSALRDAFVIDHLRPDVFTSYEKGESFVTVTIPTPYAERPASWDGPSDAAMARVSFAVLLGDEPGQYLRVRPAEGVVWRSPQGKALADVRVVPPRMTLTPGTAPRQLPAFRIAIR